VDICDVQNGNTSLISAAHHLQNLDVVRHLCEVGGKELIMMQNEVCPREQGD
jgi:hypothetical protein